jgi:putative transposase
MPTYRRNHVPGGVYFFTVAIAERRRDLLVRHIDQLKAAIRQERARNPFATLGLVVLPDHIHAVWRLPPGDVDYSNRWRRIKCSFSAALPRGERRSASRVSKGERGIWQRRFWEHTMRDEDDLRRHLDYLHFNPVKHGLVPWVADWPHSTFHAYLRRGVYPENWGGVDTTIEGYGE